MRKLSIFLMLSILFFIAPIVSTADGYSMDARAHCYFTTPADGATVSGTIDISISASKAPTLYLDGVRQGRGYDWTWDTTGADGPHTLYAKCPGASATIYITVDNGGTPPPDTEAPVVSITNPANGATVSDTVTITMDASDNVGVTSTKISIDGVQVSTGTSYNWDTTGYTDGAHTILCEAWDAAGNVGSDSHSVTVDNSVTPPPDNELTSGETVYSSLAAKGETEMWTIEVVGTKDSMRSVLNCGSADFDLYGRLGVEPTTSTYDWRGYTTGGEDVTYSMPGEGTWYIMVRSYSGSGPYDLTVTLTEPTPPEEWSTTGTKYAIIVGISDYASISDLNYCDEDATDWYNFLDTKGYEMHVYGDGHTSNYPKHNDLATESKVRTDMQALAAVANAGDTVVFTTSGHGSGDGSGSSFLCMYDCSGSQGCYYDTELAADIALFAPGVNIFVFIDHCYAGGMGPELMALSNSDYIYCTTTCTEDGYGWDDGSHQNGAWTYEYLEKYYVNYPTNSVESIYDMASATYPHSGGDACMEFDGDTSTNMYL
jgi:hypothetical protein